MLNQIKIYMSINFLKNWGCFVPEEVLMMMDLPSGLETRREVSEKKNPFLPVSPKNVKLKNPEKHNRLIAVDS